MREKLSKKIPGKRKQPERATKPVANNRKDEWLVCIGASAGGFNAVRKLVSQFPPGMNAAVFIVLHLSKVVVSDIFTNKIQKETKLPVRVATNHAKIEAGHIYLAPVDVHTLIKKDRILIGHGPPENRFRPSIDVLFRSAAASHGQRVTGVVLTGYLNDGTAGMWAIKQCGGHCIVQDPNEAEYPDMPLSVLESVEVDHVVALNKMGRTILKSIGDTKRNGIIPPATVIAESKLSEKVATAIEGMEKVGEKTVYGCPDCGGSLFEVKTGKTNHYRCHVGHAYTERDLLLLQEENAEKSIWVALRMMEERKTLLLKTAGGNGKKGFYHLAEQYKKNAEKLAVHIERIKELLVKMSEDPPPT